MRDGAHKAGRVIAPQGQERPSVPSARAGREKMPPQAADAPQGEVSGNRRKATPERVLAEAKQAALAIEACGSQIAKAVDRMQAATAAWRKSEMPKDKRDAVWIAEWHEIMLNLNEHADALLVLLSNFCGASCFRHIQNAEVELELDEAAKGETDGGAK